MIPPLHTSNLSLSKLLTPGNLSALSQLVPEAHATVRGLRFVVTASSGATFKVTFAHVMVLHVCLTPRIHRMDEILVSKIIQQAYTGSKVTLNELCQWECDTDGVHTASPLHLASFYGSLILVRTLTEAGADPNIRSDKHLTPLHFATMTTSPGGHQVVYYLCTHSASAKLTSASGVSPLHIALARGACAQSIKVLITRGHAEVNGEKRRGLRTPLIQASALCDLDTIQCLVEEGADLGYHTPRSQNALHYAVARGEEGPVHTLLTLGGNCTD